MGLTARQRLADDLHSFLRARGAWVTSPLPLRDTDPLRFECRSGDNRTLTEKLNELGFVVRFCGTSQQMRPNAVVESHRDGNTIKTRTHAGPCDVTTFEAMLPE